MIVSVETSTFTLSPWRAHHSAQDSQEINAQLPIVHDSSLDAYLNALGDSIASHTPRADLRWHFYLVNTNEVHAFALPAVPREG